jgi:hypothetical protein
MNALPPHGRSLGLGPVSTALEADLRKWVQRHGIVVWLDLDGHYGDFIGRLAELRIEEKLSYDVYSFGGSHLELLLALEHVASGNEKPRMVLHLPGFNEDTVRSTPLLELYLAGMRYRTKLETLVKNAAAGQARPEETDLFLEQVKHSGEALTLEAADTWLADLLAGSDGEATSRLRGRSLLSLVDELLGGAGGELVGRIGQAAFREALWARLEAASGMTTAWRTEAVVPGATPAATDIAHAVCSWALCVEYVDDLQRAPVAASLTGMDTIPKKLIADCCELAQHLREHHAEFYGRTADETELRLADEIARAEAEDLGRIDTFRFEDEAMLQAGLTALEARRYVVARDWAKARVDGRSFWLRETPARRSSWELVQAAADLGAAIEAAGAQLEARSLVEAVERYRTAGAQVDRDHRDLEQQRAAKLFAQVPDFETLRARLDALRAHWREWADAWARDFNALCKQEGFSPPAELQQRTVFEQVVQPLCREAGEARAGDVTALFLIDALRYELAEELATALSETPATTVRLEARLAELPTETAVGMNALAPVADGDWLQPVIQGKKRTAAKIKGFATSEFQVHDPETRRKAALHRVGGATCPSFALAGEGGVLSRSPESLRQGIARAKLVIVHDQQIDAAGHHVGPEAFGRQVQRLRTAWRLLRDAGVRRFVITADHGFLLATGVPAQPHGGKRVPGARHVLSTVGADHTDEVRVPLSALRYRGVEDLHLMMPAGIAVFDRGQRDTRFVHGGNSLQERVIPVLTLEHRAAAGGTTHRYRVIAEADEGVGGMHCVRGQIDSVNPMLFGGLTQLELELRVLDEPTTGGAVRVELCQARRAAKLSSGDSFVAQIGPEFELFFRLLGRTDARVQVQLVHSGAQAEVIAGDVEQRFAVEVDTRASAGTPETDPSDAATKQDNEWLAAYEDAGVRAVVAHLAAHDAITETEVAEMLGSARAARRFARSFSAYASKAPFGIHIKMAGNLKRYVRTGSEA